MLPSNRLKRVYNPLTCGMCSKVLETGSLYAWDSFVKSHNTRCVVDANGKPGCWHDKFDASTIADKLAGKNGNGNGHSNGNGHPAESPSPISDTPATSNNGHSDVFSALANSLLPHLESKIKTKVDEDRVLELIEQAINSASFQRIHIVENGQIRGKLEGIVHPIVPQALSLLTIGMNVYMYGPPGGGKTHAAAQIAKALNVPLVPMQMSKLSPESAIKGFVDAQGHQQEQTFIEAIQKPSLLFLDELDRWPAHLVTLLNGLLANGYLIARGHDEPIQRHAQCYILAAGNTTMRGRDEYFPEAQAQEFSTLDRFSYLHFSYDETVEERIALNINPACGPWIKWVRSIRPEAMSGRHGKVLATPRTSYDGARILRYTDMPVSAVADSVCFKGIDGATRDKLVSMFPLPAGNMKPKD